MDGRESGSRSGTPDGVHEPVPPALARLLRRAVLDLARGERRRVFAPVVHVGVPGVIDARLDLEGAELGRHDHALRVDCLEALVRRADRSRSGGRAAPQARHPRRASDPEPAALLVWLTRPGDLDVEDLDVAWSAAAAAAACELDRRLPMVVVAKQGWRDVRTGAGCTWRRIRDRTGAPVEPEGDLSSVEPDGLEPA